MYVCLPTSRSVQQRCCYIFRQFCNNPVFVTHNLTSARNFTQRVFLTDELFQSHWQFTNLQPLFFLSNRENCPLLEVATQVDQSVQVRSTPDLNFTRHKQLVYIPILPLHASNRHTRIMSQFHAKQFSEEQIASVADLEPALESLLRNAEVDEGIITVQRNHTRSLFAALDSTEEGPRATETKFFGVDVESGGFSHNENHHSVDTRREMTETKVEIDALAHAHREQTQMLPENWDELLNQEKVGSNLLDKNCQVSRTTEEAEVREKAPRVFTAVWHSLGQYTDCPNEKKIHVQYAAQCRRTQSQHGPIS